MFQSFFYARLHKYIYITGILPFGFGEKKKGQEANFSDLSLMVTPTVRLSNQLMESFKRIYDLKDVVPVRLLQPATIPYRLRKVI